MDKIDKQAIEAFDALESYSDGELNDELKAIRRTDLYLMGATSNGPSADFTSKVMRSALIERRRRSSRLFFVVVMVLLLLPLSTVVLFVSSAENSVAMPVLSWVVDKISMFVSRVDGSQMSLFFIAMEAIVCLMFLDKLLGRNGMFRASGR